MDGRDPQLYGFRFAFADGCGLMVHETCDMDVCAIDDGNDVAYLMEQVRTHLDFCPAG